MDATAEELLETAKSAQAAYWDAVSDLESELGVELDGEDLSTYTIDTLKEAFGE